MSNNSLTALVAAQIYAVYESALDANKKLNNELRDISAENQQLRKENAQLVAALMRAGAERHEIEPVLIGMGQDSLNEIERLISEIAQLRDALGAIALEYRGRNKETAICRYCKQSAYTPLGPSPINAIKHKPDCKVAQLLALESERNT